MTSIEIESYVPIRAAIFQGVVAHIDFSEIGVRQFIVTAVEPEGRTILWDGDSYENAIIAAEELAVSFDCCVHDRVAEGSA